MLEFKVQIIKIIIISTIRRERSLIIAIRQTLCRVANLVFVFIGLCSA